MRKTFAGLALASSVLAVAASAQQSAPATGGDLPPPVDSLAPGAGESASAQPPASSASALDMAKDHLTAGRFADALTAAKDAQAAAPDNFEAHYYVAMAQLGLHQYEAALGAAQRAQSLAPQDAQGQILKLISTINGLRTASDGSTEAEVALADGLVAKAARIYDGLFQQSPAMTEYGLKAADLYANRLSQWADAGRMLNQVVKAAPESPEAEKAKAELARLKPQLDTAYKRALTDSFLQEWPQAHGSLKRAMGIHADATFPLWLTISRGVEANDSTAVQEAVAELAKRGPIDRNRLAAVPGIDRFVAQPRFATFLSDVLGAPGVEAIARNARPAVSARPVLDRLLLKKELMYYVGKGCSGPCSAAALFVVTNVNETNRCEWTVNLGRAHFNQYSDQPTAWTLHWSEAAPLQVRSRFDPRVPWIVVGTETQNEQETGRYIGFVVKRPEDADALAQALKQKSAYCMGSISR